MKNTFICDSCGLVVPFAQGDDEAAEIEALELFGVPNAASNPGMAIICDDCFEKMRRRMDAAREPFPGQN